MGERRQIMHLEVDFSKLTDAQMRQCQEMCRQVAALFTGMVMNTQVTSQGTAEMLMLTPYALAMALHAAQAGADNVRDMAPPGGF